MYFVGKMKQITKTTKWETQEYYKFESIKNWFNSLEQIAITNKKTFSNHAKRSRMSVIIRFYLIIK